MTVGHNDVEAGLVKGGETINGTTAEAPIMGQPVYPGGYQGQPVMAMGYQGGYQQGVMPGQQPVWGAPAPGYGAAVGSTPYPYPPPPPMGGGVGDEKFQISDVGVCTVVPGLKPWRARLVFMSVIVIMAACGVIWCGFSIFMNVNFTNQWFLYPFSGLYFGMAVVLALIMMRRVQTKKYPRITPQAIDEIVRIITEFGATLPQIAAVQSLMQQANPDTPHEFNIWKSRLDYRGRQRGRLVTAKFGIIATGMQPQQHMYALL